MLSHARRVSVVVPVLNGEPTLADCLKALRAQTLSKSDYEIIVVVDRATTDSRSSKIFRCSTDLRSRGRRGSGAKRRNKRLEHGMGGIH